MSDGAQVVMERNGDKHWYMQFQPADWLSDVELGMCKESTRGIWADALCCMFMRGRCGQLVGTINDLARLCRTTPNAMRAAVDDLRDRNAADIQESSGVVTLENRRMRREWLVRLHARKRKELQRIREANVDSCHEEVTHSVTPKSPLTVAVTLSSDSSFRGKGVGKGMAERIYLAYPRHVEKQAALKAIGKAIELIADRPDEPEGGWGAWLLGKTESFAKAREDVEKVRPDAMKFTPHPATWFNRGSYDDDEAEWSRDAVAAPVSRIDAQRQRLDEVIRRKAEAENAET